MCEGNVLTKVLALTPTPPGNNFLKPHELAAPEPTYPLDLYFCTRCYHVQLGHVVDPTILYQTDYTYVSATGASFVAHLRQYATDMAQRFGLGSESLVVDIGSNDGTCLSFFAQAGTKVLGVDPATAIAQRATQSGVETVNDFFSHDLAVRLRAAHGPAAFITSHNACAHIDQLDDVMRGVSHWLAPDGVFVLEVGYLLDVYQHAWFDTIYHEHLDYHTVAPFQQLFERTGLKMIGVERISPQGGSLRVFAQRRDGPRRADGTAARLMEQEHREKLHIPDTFVEWGQRIDRVGVKLRTLVSDLKKKGHTLAGYGAGTKATTLLSHFRIGCDELDFIVDDNPLKQGLFSPASHIPIVAPSELERRRPDYLLILAWNFGDAIMASQTRFASQGGRFILPMPVVRVIP